MPVDDKIIGMVNKDGRKKAVERLKQYERDLQDLERKKSGLDIMRLAFKEKV